MAAPAIALYIDGGAFFLFLFFACPDSFGGRAKKENKSPPQA
jgi:hypothetical protein